MFSGVKTEIGRIRGAEPGQRFLQRQQRHVASGVLRRSFAVTAGVFCLALGVVMIPFPGPGWITVALGIALLSGESRRIAGALDRLEIWGRRQIDTHWKPLRYKWIAWVFVILAALLAGALTLWVTNWLRGHFGWF
jgi:uncharacterized protein (TIGR02611 family)